MDERSVFREDRRIAWRGARAGCVVLLGALVLALSCGRTASRISPGDCTTLAGRAFGDATIDRAAAQPANQPIDGARMPGRMGEVGQGPPIAGLPAFCRVAGRIQPEPGSDIRFEVWLPDAWDGRLHGVGIGGFAGSISYRELAAAIVSGQAASATDTGHQSEGIESAWARGRPERVRDYGWRAIHLTAVVSKQIVAAYYGRDAEHAYFNGCSGGGRQALMEASRFPDDYDGIVAGAPAAPFTKLAMSMIAAQQAQRSPGTALRPDQMGLLQAEVLDQCDAVDGRRDGLVADPLACAFDASSLGCGPSASPACFSEVQIEALVRIHDGPRDSQGRQVASGYVPSGVENAGPYMAWDQWIAADHPPPHLHHVFGNGLLTDLIDAPFATLETFDFDEHPARLQAALAPDLDPVPDLSRFFDRGGKLVLYHGWGDPAIPAQHTLELYEEALRRSGPQAADSMRLFLVPGMLHCAGGTGASDFGQLSPPPPGAAPERNVVSAVQAWVEEGRVPDELVGRRLGLTSLPGGGEGEPAPVKEVLLCAHPKRPVLAPGADVDRLESYDCRE